jgi:hypothetical protein
MHGQLLVTCITLRSKVAFNIKGSGALREVTGLHFGSVAPLQHDTFETQRKLQTGRRATGEKKPCAAAPTQPRAGADVGSRAPPLLAAPPLSAGAPPPSLISFSLGGFASRVRPW